MGTDRLEAVLEHALTAYHCGERHGGAHWIAEGEVDSVLVPVAREAFQDADALPDDAEVLQAFDEPMPLLGEGYHVIAVTDAGRRFAVKYVKHATPVPPLEHPPASSQPEWMREHGIRPGGCLHPAIWQHIRAFEAYGPLAVPSRTYIADGAAGALSDDERLALARYRAIGIVRSLGREARCLRVEYPPGFAAWKRAPDGVAASLVVVQPMVTPLAAAIEGALRAGDIGAARDLESRYREFTEQLWHCGVSHLDFSILNIGIVGSGPAERLQIFDPHMGAIDVGAGGEVRDPMHASGERPLDHVLRSSRDGSRWALWQVQEDLSASSDVQPRGAAAAADLVREFHAASEGLETGQGSFGLEHFGRTWQRHPTHTVNSVMHAQLWELLRHPLGELTRSVLDPATSDAPYDRSLDVLEMHGDRPLEQFRSGLRVYEGRPVVLIANVAEGAPRFAKHWGRMRLPAELDVQDDPAIHYHLRDLVTGEVYVRPGDELVRDGLVVGLAPAGLHALQVEDVSVEHLAVERSLASHRDISGLLRHCTRRVGVVGDIHGELQALKEILDVLGFLDAFGHWSGRDGTLIFTGDVGHGRHLREVFDFIHRLAAQAHRVGGRVVWTLGNHDLYVDREGGQGGVSSIGYRLWPQIREAALHPDRHPGLTVQAAYFAYGKLFVHGGVLPNIVALAIREYGAGDAETVAAYVNDVLGRTLVEHERISARDLPHEIFEIGTSHTRERRMPGEIGYEPAGVFTPDLRELDHYRYHDALLPQVVGHTASVRGEIRYAPGSWLRRDYIAVDVGRQHGFGNGGLLLTDFGWVAVTPGGPARFVEVAPLFVQLAHEAGDQVDPGQPPERMLREYFKAARPKRTRLADPEQALLADLSPAQVVALERVFDAIRRTGRCGVVTDQDAMLTAFAGAPGEDAIQVIADYLAAGGVFVIVSETSFEWLYARLLIPLIVQLGPRSPLLSRLLLGLSDGAELFGYEDGAFHVMWSGAGRGSAGSFEMLTALAGRNRGAEEPVLDAAAAVYIANSSAPRRVDRDLARRVGSVIDVGDALPRSADKPVGRLHHGYQRMRDAMAAAGGAMRESGRTPPSPEGPAVGDTALWTFDRPRFRPGRRLRVRVGGSGFVHAGRERSDGHWAPVYDVPLIPLEVGGYEAVLPAGVNAFTFFWTEAPWTPGRPGHWERQKGTPGVFRASA